MTKPILKNVKIPFSGFYESTHDEEIDRAINSYFDRKGDGDEGHTPENFYRSFDHHGDIRREYVALYVKHFAAYFEAETDVKLPCVFEALTSPREYNFETDRIFCDVPLAALENIYLYCDKDVLRAHIEDRCTSRSGFHSFYANTLDAWQRKPFADWDHNELGILIQAALLTAHHERGHRRCRAYKLA